MSLNDVQKKLEFAINAVKDIPEPFKVKAFEVILTATIGTPITKMEKTTEGITVKQDTNSEFSLAKLVSVTKLSDDQLGNVYHFGENEPDIVAKLNGSEADKQIHGTMLILLVMKYYYGQEWVKAAFVSKKLTDYGIGALSHLAQNLDKHQSEFLSKGKKKGTEYKLSIQGEQTALSFVKGLFEPQ